MPLVRPFRALRYSAEVAPDLAAVVAPPYDVVDEEEHRRLLARDPRNVIRLDLPAAQAGDEPDERYRRAAHLLASWRSDGTLRQETGPAVYVYEQSFAVPGTDDRRVRRGFFARLRLEPFGPGSGVRPHERTLAAPKEDRYRLLRATAVNTSPIVAMYEDPSGTAASILDGIAATTPDRELVDDRGVGHRLWVVRDGAADRETAGESRATVLCARAGAGPITIADGHHRYETALRYRNERHVGAEAAADPAYDYVLALLLEPRTGPLVVLATHRIVLDVGDDTVARLREALGSLFEVEEGVTRDRLLAAFAPANARGGEGRFGIWTRGWGAILTARRSAFESVLPPGGAAVDRLDVTLLGAAMERLLGIDPAAVSSGARIAFTKDAREAIDAVDSRRDGADIAFLLDPTPASEIVAVAADGDVMPQKSTYIYPKALTGLVINPLEW